MLTKRLSELSLPLQGHLASLWNHGSFPARYVFGRAKRAAFL